MQNLDAAATLDYILGLNLTDDQRRAKLLTLAGISDRRAAAQLRAGQRALAAGWLDEAAEHADVAEFYNNRAKRLLAEARAI